MHSVDWLSEGLSCCIAVFFSIIAVLFVSVDRALKFTWQRTLFKQLGPPSWEYPQNFLFKPTAVAGPDLLPMNANLWRTLLQHFWMCLQKDLGWGRSQIGRAFFSLAIEFAKLVKLRALLISLSLSLHWFCKFFSIAIVVLGITYMKIFVRSITCKHSEVSVKSSHASL